MNYNGKDSSCRWHVLLWCYFVPFCDYLQYRKQIHFRRDERCWIQATSHLFIFKLLNLLKELYLWYVWSYYSAQTPKHGTQADTESSNLCRIYLKMQYTRATVCGTFLTLNILWNVEKVVCVNLAYNLCEKFNKKFLVCFAFNSYIWDVYLVYALSCFYFDLRDGHRSLFAETVFQC